MQAALQMVQQLQHQQAVVRDVLALGLANTQANAAAAGLTFSPLESPLCNLVTVVLGLLTGGLPGSYEWAGILLYLTGSCSVGHVWPKYACTLCKQCSCAGRCYEPQSACHRIEVRMPQAWSDTGLVTAGAVAPGLMQQPDVIALLRAPQSPSAERPVTANPVSLAQQG